MKTDKTYYSWNKINWKGNTNKKQNHNNTTKTETLFKWKKEKYTKKIKKIQIANTWN